MYPFKYFCFDLLPFDCLVKSYLKGVAEGTKSRQIQSVVLPEHIPLRRAVVWSEQINHFGVHTLHPNSVSGGVGGDVGWLGAALARRITRPPPSLQDWGYILQENEWFNKLKEDMAPGEAIAHPFIESVQSFAKTHKISAGPRPP